MSNIFEIAQEFYKQNPQAQVIDKRRKVYTKKLLFIIETAPFLTANEKAQMQGLIPLYSTRVIMNVKKSLIQQGMIFLQMDGNNPELKSWLQQVNPQG